MLNQSLNSVTKILWRNSLKNSIYYLANTENTQFSIKVLGFEVLGSSRLTMLILSAKYPSFTSHSLLFVQKISKLFTMRLRGAALKSNTDSRPDSPLTPQSRACRVH